MRDADSSESLDSIWPQIAEGTALEFQSAKELPAPVATELLAYFQLKELPDERHERNHFVFFRPSDGRQYLLIKSTGHYPFEVSKLYKIENGKLELVALPVGNPTDGFSTTADLGSSEVDVKKGVFKTLFFFDVCGDQVWYSEFKYLTQRSGFKLVQERQINCGTGQWRTIWSAELPPEWPVGAPGKPVSFPDSKSIPPFLIDLVKCPKRNGKLHISSATFYQLETGVPLVTWKCSGSESATFFGVWRDSTIHTANFIVSGKSETFHSVDNLIDYYLSPKNGMIVSSDRASTCSNASAFHEHQYILQYGGYQLAKISEINCVNGKTSVTWKARE